MHFLPLDGNKSNPSHEFAGDRKNLLAWWCFRNWHMYASMTSKQQIEWPIFRVLPLIFLKWGIFSAYSYFLLAGLLSVLFVCFTFSCSYFLIKWKVCFCFLVKRNSLTKHTDKYRKNDFTMIYKNYRKSKLCWFTCKLPNQNHNTFNMNPCSAHRFMGGPPDYFSQPKHML